ncbi:hypothetical protein BCR34DRAFT_117585 [Clohesyomyces aquaticus]|uniref:Uncharacterized protein n=1 Tax=Clohesyomyces aquaticus TaxID=1231657 RepID=A0A1Y1YPR4_9PLEO|nr:hypothetical protein BCR34DRAFT_117585 [Clohesyomyces aquaticus]
MPPSREPATIPAPHSPPNTNKNAPLTQRPVPPAAMAPLSILQVRNTIFAPSCVCVLQPRHPSHKISVTIQPRPFIFVVARAPGPSVLSGQDRGICKIRQTHPFLFRNALSPIGTSASLCSPLPMSILYCSCSSSTKLLHYPSPAASWPDGLAHQSGLLAKDFVPLDKNSIFNIRVSTINNGIVSI